MNQIFYIVVNTSCPRCGQDALKVIRRSLPRKPIGRPEAINEDCMDCIVKDQPLSTRHFLIRQWRLMWQQAGGSVNDMPAVLRDRNDGKQLRSPNVIPAPRQAHAKGLASRSQSSGFSKNPCEILGAVQPAIRRPRVLFIGHSLHPRGAERILLNIIPYLRGMDCAVWPLEEGLLRAEYIRAGIPIVSAPDWKQYDLVVGNTLAAHSGMLRAMTAGLPLLWLIHEWNFEGLIDLAQYNRLASYCRKLVFAHAAQREQFPSLPITSERIINTVIPPRLPGDRKEARRTIGINENDFMVLSFGQNEERKGQIDLHNAVSGSSMKLLCVADAADVTPFLDAADVYVSSSRRECYPLSIQEAKSHGLPVIATAIPVHQDMIDHGGNGFLYNPGDSPKLRELLLLLHKDDETRRRIAAAPLHGPSFEDTVVAYERLLLEEAGGQFSTEQPIHVVYHVCGMGSYWHQVVYEQLLLLKRHGLRRILATHVGAGLDWLLHTARGMDLDLTVCSHFDSLLLYERPAVEVVERLAHSSERPVLYLHTKGVSHPQSEEWYHEWRRLMEQELVPNWRRLALQLDTYDAIGVNWWSMYDKWHFSGNFWLASPRWLRKLPSLTKFWKDRWSAERWIGSIAGCNALSLLCRDAAFWDKERELLKKLRREQLERQKGQKHGLG